MQTASRPPPSPTDSTRRRFDVAAFQIRRGRAKKPRVRRRWNTEADTNSIGCRIIGTFRSGTGHAETGLGWSHLHVGRDSDGSLATYAAAGRVGRVRDGAKRGRTPHPAEMGLKSSTPCLDGAETSESHGGISSISVHEEESLILQEEWLHDVCGVPQARLTVKNGDDNKSQSKEATLDNLNEKDEPPSPEEVKSWSESFDKLMNGSAGRKVFREFLRSEYSEENMLFWLACEDLKSEQNPELVEEKARLIYEDYISILSPKEVSLDSRVREVINRNMVDPTSHTFDEAQLQIYTLMHRDSYPRFLNSQIYKRLLQKQQLQQSPPSPQQLQPLPQQPRHHQQQQ